MILDGGVGVRSVTARGRSVIMDVMQAVNERRERVEGLSDAELLARTSTDLDAFAAFYRRHVAWVLRVAARRTRSPEHAGDLTAEVFASAFLAAGRFRPMRPDGAANSWLFGILLNKLAGFERRGAVERRGRARLRMREPVLTAGEFEMYATQDERAPSIAAALDRLPSEQRDAVRRGSSTSVRTKRLRRSCRSAKQTRANASAAGWLRFASSWRKRRHERLCR